MVQRVTGGVVARAWAGHRHAVGGVRAAVLGRVQLPAELTVYGEREVGVLLSRLPLKIKNTYSQVNHNSSFLKITNYLTTQLFVKSDVRM